MDRTSGIQSPLASLIAGSGAKTATSKQKVAGMRGYTTGRSVGDFFAAHSNNPFLKSLYLRTKKTKMRKELEERTSKGGRKESRQTQDQDQDSTKDTRDSSKEVIKSIETLKRQFDSVEKVTVENQKDTKELIKAISEIKKGIVGIKGVIRKFKGSLDKIANSITPSPTNSLAGSAAKMYSAAGADTKELLKPIDVKSREGESYLYYRGAPEGRQFYKKGKEGTAGTVASKDTAKELYTALERKLAAMTAKMTGGGDGGGGSKALAPKDYGQVKEVDNREETEKLEKALEEALRKVLPGALAEAGAGGQTAMIGGGGDGGGTDLLSAPTGIIKGLAKGAASIGRAAWSGVKGIGSKIGNLFKRGGGAATAAEVAETATAAEAAGTTATAATKAAEETAEATATKGAEKAGVKVAEKAGVETAEKVGVKTAAKAAGKTGLKTLVKKIPIIGAIAGLGFAAQRAMGGDWTGAAMEAGSGLAGTIPGVGTAASLGLDAALAAKDMGVFDKKTATPNPVTGDLPGSIVERTSSLVSSSKQVAPPVIVNAPTTNAAPPPPPQEKPTASTPVMRNPDDSFIRSISKDFFHPSSTYRA